MWVEKMNKLQKTLLWAAFLMSAYALLRSFPLFPVTMVNNEKDSAFAGATAKHMRSCLRELTGQGDAVHFVFPENSYGIMVETTPNTNYPDLKYPSWTGDFVLRVGESFRARPDHHSSGQYTLKAIEPPGIVLVYDTRFDHRSFGKNLINVNRGELRIPWKSRDQANQAPEDAARKLSDPRADVRPGTNNACR